MSGKLIELIDGTLVEVEYPTDQVQAISGKFAEKVDASLDKILPILTKTCRPISIAWDELNKNYNIEKTEIELGLAFEAEGNIFITKSKAQANITVKFTIKKK